MSHNMRIETLPDATASVLAKKAAEALDRHISSHWSEYGDGFCLLMSGGSALTILDNGLDSSLFGKNTKVGILDERISDDPKASNFLQFKQTKFYGKLAKSGVFFIDIKDGKFSTLASKIPIIATVGIGPDGHTSGMMPFPENPEYFEKTFNRTDQLVIEYDATGKSKFARRLTTTLPFMRKIDYAVGIMTGEEKKQALERITAKEGTLSETPARIFREMKKVDIFTNIEIRR